MMDKRAETNYSHGDNFHSAYCECGIHYSKEKAQEAAKRPWLKSYITNTGDRLSRAARIKTYKRQVGQDVSSTVLLSQCGRGVSGQSSHLKSMTVDSQSGKNNEHEVKTDRVWSGPPPKFMTSPPMTYRG